MTSQILAIEPNCDWPLIPNLNGHISTKYPTCDSKPIASKGFLEARKEGFCDYWRSSIRKTGASTFARIGIERELRDNQNFSIDIKKRAVHLALFVAKDTQIDNFISQHLYLNLAVVTSY